MGQSDARNYERGFQKATFLSRIMEYDLPADFSKKQNELLNKLTVADVNTLASQNIPDVNKMNVVLVGDKAKLWSGLEKLGYEMVELDKNGDPIVK